MQFRILGLVEGQDEQTGLRILPTGAKQRALLGALVVRAGHNVSAPRLIDELWGQRPPANAANALQVHVARLRRQLSGPGRRTGQHPPPPWIVTTSHGYTLRPAAAETDAVRFARLTAQGRQTLRDDPGQAADVLRRALALWRGPALEGSVIGDICAVEAAQLEEGRLTALEMMYDAYLRTGRHGEITGELVELIVDHPMRETFYDLLMVAFYRCGRQAEALGVYARAHHHMMRELGVAPGPALRALRERILRQDPALAAAPGPMPPAVPRSAAGTAGPAAGTAADDMVLPLYREIAGLHRRIEQLQQEQHRLLSRFDELTAHAGRPVTV